MNCRRTTREGKVLVLIAILMPSLAGMGAFAIDTGYIVYTRARLQAAAEAAALVAVEQLPEAYDAVSRAQGMAQFNLDGHSNVLATQDVEFGTWSDGTFVLATPEDANAVRVTARLSQQNGNQLSLFFGRLWGTSRADIQASAIAAKPTGGIGTRFLIDEDMFDKDLPSIENLANSLGRDPETLVTARGFNAGKTYGASDWTWADNFIDIPAGSQLTLPTGQGTDYDNNDAGLFDISNSNFAFTDDVTFMEFVMYSETGGDTSKWGTDDSYIYNNLDPLDGVEPVTDAGLYDSFVNPEFTHISPVFPSDISTLNKLGDVPRVNARGLRRGLLAYKIVAVGVDIDGDGSVLPQLKIEIVDPTTISPDDVERANNASGGSIQLVK